MVFPLNQLPLEIIQCHVLPLLDAESIISLGRVIHVKITREMYHGVFHESTHFDHYGMEMFTERARAKLYVVGGSSHFRTICKNSGQYYERFGNSQRMCALMPLPAPDQEIQDVEAGIWNIVARNSVGRIKFATFPLFDFPHAEGEMRGRQRNYEDRPYEGQVYPEDVSGEVREFSNGYLEQPFESSRFVKMFATQPILAQDQDGLMWTVSFGHGGQALPFVLVDKFSKERISGKILMARTGRICCSCLIRGRGLVWWSSSQIAFLLSLNPGWRNGYPCHNGRFMVVEAGTTEVSDRIRDYIVVEEYVFLLEYDGTITAIRYTDSTSAFPDDCLDDLNSKGPFMQLSLSEKQSTFALVTENGCVVVVDVDKYSFTSHLVNGLPKVASVEAKFGRFLALTITGEVYVWGKEQIADGSLGLGKFGRAVHEGAELEVQDFHRGCFALAVDRPIKMELPGRAYAVFAGINYSVVLLYEKKRKRTRNEEEVSGLKRIRIGS